MRSIIRITFLFLLFIPAALFAATAGSIHRTVVGADDHQPIKLAVAQLGRS